MTAVVELMDEIGEKYNLNASRMYVTGLSMGGFGTWDLLMRYPGVFAAAIPMGGAGDVSKVNIIKNTPVWTFHQMYDPVVASAGTVAMVKALVNVGAEVKFTPYFDNVHDTWTKGYAEKGLLQWLYSHTRDKKKVAFVGDSITYGAAIDDRATEKLLSDNTYETTVTDGASDWAKGEIALSYAAGIMPGILRYSYKSDITRKEFCELVVNILPENLQPVREANFEDCKNEKVNYAYSVGIVNGVSDTAFAPDKNATREEMATMLYRAFRLIAPEAAPNGTVNSPDKAMISDWATEAVSFLNENKIMQGDDMENNTMEKAVIIFSIDDGNKDLYSVLKDGEKNYGGMWSYDYDKFRELVSYVKTLESCGKVDLKTTIDYAENI